MNINYMLQGQGRVKLFYEVAQIKNSVAQNWIVPSLHNSDSCI